MAGALTGAHVFLLLHVRHVEAPQVHRRHAECKLANRTPLSQPIREPGQVAVTVQVVRVEAPGRGRDRGKTLSQHEPGRLPLAEQSGPNLFAPLPSGTALGGHSALCTTESPQEPPPWYRQATDDRYRTRRPHPVLRGSLFLHRDPTLFFPTQESPGT